MQSQKHSAQTCPPTVSLEASCPPSRSANWKLTSNLWPFLPLPAQHRPAGHPPRPLGREGGRGRRGRLRHRHGDPLRQPDRELLVRRAGNPDGTEEVGSAPVFNLDSNWFLFLVLIWILTFSILRCILDSKMFIFFVIIWILTGLYPSLLSGF